MKKRTIYLLIAVLAAVVLGLWFGSDKSGGVAIIAPQQRQMPGATPTTSQSPIEQRNQVSPPIKATTDSTPTALSNKQPIDPEIQTLIREIGTRAKPKDEPKSVAELAAQHDDDLHAPLESVFPNAQKLVAKGNPAALPLAEYWAKLTDPKRDDYIASLRVLRSLMSRDDTQALFTKLAAQAPDDQQRSQYLRAADCFAPVATSAR
jgi:hypothetical protein